MYVAALLSFPKKWCVCISASVQCRYNPYLSYANTSMNNHSKKPGQSQYFSWILFQCIMRLSSIFCTARVFNTCCLYCSGWPLCSIIRWTLLHIFVLLFKSGCIHKHTKGRVIFLKGVVIPYSLHGSIIREIMGCQCTKRSLMSGPVTCFSGLNVLILWFTRRPLKTKWGWKSNRWSFVCGCDVLHRIVSALKDKYTHIPCFCDCNIIL